ncbi:NADH-ubiquinone oxidoreductase [Saccharibacter sp. 17.LH.SD]|uniref:SDR family oxidoreductase n=1 Tax=Saccharibacter sp. 17.LH.SD TaxID=2689393 RepID=UPI0013684C89|nr:NADH-ubiquinone oxidoreductase [Saccharibacter sp. 17.LH.SD]MXV43764.1 NADH-ubiquinone oxidoreductase [Saccharibacter sp. 17.LH.SD]
MKPFYPTPVGIIGATGRTGFALCRKLLDSKTPIIAFTRQPRKLRARLSPRDLPFIDIRQIDLTQPHTLPAAFHDVACLVNTAHARFLPTLLASTKAPMIALGSTRKFTQWPDDHARGVLAGETALQADPRPSLILHPTMIYGTEGENNVQRLAQLLRYLPVIPLPKRGRSWVQPIEQSDVTRCLCAALTLMACHDIQHAESLNIAGAERVSYRQFITLILRYSGSAPRLIITFPVKFLMILSRLSRILPGVPTVTPEEIRRLLEDKDIDITAMQQRLGVHPIRLTNGLARLFAYPRGKHQQSNF